MIRLIFLMICLLMAPVSFAITPDYSLWTTAVFNGKFSPDSPYFYQFETHFRFTDDPISLWQNVERIRLGKHQNKNLDFVIGVDYVPTQPANKKWIEFQGLWQQITYKAFLNPYWRMTFWGRIEQRRLQGRSDTEWRNRSGIKFDRCRQAPGACPIAFVESFTNIYRPDWEVQNTLGQQRVYVGVKQKFTPKTSMNIGYLGQFLWTKSLNRRFDVMSVVFFHSFD